MMSVRGVAGWSTVLAMAGLAIAGCAGGEESPPQASGSPTAVAVVWRPADVSPMSESMLRRCKDFRPPGPVSPGRFTSGIAMTGTDRMVTVSDVAWVLTCRGGKYQAHSADVEATVRPAYERQVGALLTALAAPDALPDGRLCDAQFRMPREAWLVMVLRDNTYLQPLAPLRGCGRTNRAVAALVNQIADTERVIPID